MPVSVDGWIGGSDGLWRVGGRMIGVIIIISSSRSLFYFNLLLLSSSCAG